ncbi:MAG: SurA N-terminal domain-containing protein, partial [Pseudomonadota bacterium]
CRVSLANKFLSVEKIMSVKSLSRNIVVRILLFILLIAFVLSGAASFLGGSNISGNNIAVIGSTNLELREFNRYLQRTMQENPQQDIQTVKTKLLEDLINRKLFAEYAAEIGVNIGDDVLFDEIKKLNVFHNENGEFDIELYKQTLRQSGVSEQKIIDDIHSEYVMKILFDIYQHSGQIKNSQEEKALFQYFNETRNIDYISFPITKINDVAIPTNAELQQFYEKNKDDYGLPELRDVELFHVNCNEVEFVEITEQNLLAYYKELVEQGRFDQQPAKQVKELLFDNAENANKALEMLDGNTEFSTFIDKDNILGAQYNDLGKLTAQGLPSDVGAAIFALSAGDLSEVVASDFGFHIFAVTKDFPFTVTEFADVKNKLHDEYSKKLNCEYAAELFDNLSDEFAGGLTINDAINKFPNVDLLTIGNMRSNGFDLSNQPFNIYVSSDEVLNQEINENILKNIFSLNIDDDAVTYKPAENLFIAFEVKKIHEPRIMALDEVRGIAIKQWQKLNSEDQIKQILQKVEAKINNTEYDLQKAANEFGLSLENANVRRLNSVYLDNILFPELFLHEVFARKIGQTTSYYRQHDGSYIMAVLRNINNIEQNPQIRQTIANELENEWFNSVMFDFVKYLRSEIPVEINYPLLNRE